MMVLAGIDHFRRFSLVSERNHPPTSIGWPVMFRSSIQFPPVAAEPLDMTSLMTAELGSMPVSAAPGLPSTSLLGRHASLVSHRFHGVPVSRMTSEKPSPLPALSYQSFW